MEQTTDNLRFIVLYTYDDTEEISNESFIMTEDEAYKFDALLREKYKAELKTETGRYSVVDILPLSWGIHDAEKAMEIYTD